MNAVCKFMNIIAFVKTKVYICTTLKAIHNKDYSVVKTFKAGLVRASPSFMIVLLQLVRAPSNGYPYRDPSRRAGALRNDGCYAE